MNTNCGQGVANTSLLHECLTFIEKQFVFVYTSAPRLWSVLIPTPTWHHGELWAQDIEDRS